MQTTSSLASHDLWCLEAPIAWWSWCTKVARCTCPYNLRRRLRRKAVISSRSSFWWSTAEEISSSSFAPQIHLIMARSFLWSRCRSEAFGDQVSLPWSIADQTQANRVTFFYRLNLNSHLRQSSAICILSIVSTFIHAFCHNGGYLYYMVMYGFSVLTKCETKWPMAIPISNSFNCLTMISRLYHSLEWYTQV